MLDSVSSTQFRQLCGPGVYIAWSKKERLYIGSAKNLLLRIGNPSHEGLARAQSEMERLEFIFTSSEYAARRLEMDLIGTFRPKYNKALPKGSWGVWQLNAKQV